MPLPTVILPGYLASAEPYDEMAKGLEKLGWPTIVVPLRRRDWFPTLGGRSVTPILQQLDQTVKQAMQRYHASQINLVGHSAGGWISRIYLGEVPYDVHQSDQGRICHWAAHPYIASLVTLGTPHVSQERWTRRNLDFVNNNYPGAFHQQVNYTCIAGKAIYGGQRLKNWFTYNSYVLTCGQGTCWGDGITPIAAAHLEGAKNVTLAGVTHSPKPGNIWYGSAAVVKDWATHLR
ncbi:MAG: alpha/beta hydrolase [Cyanothece sp. SIO1E1]|nr:alpha/beta hydrolase [Cyanothece sp. SIO1E1]